jgi:hypothetical protein
MNCCDVRVFFQRLPGAANADAGEQDDATVRSRCAEVKE